MTKSLNLFVRFALLSLLAVESVLKKEIAAPSRTHLGHVANKDPKYQQSTCEDLWKQKARKLHDEEQES